MGDGKSNRKAVSLNDRHYRILQDLSAPPKPSSKPYSSSSEQQIEKLSTLKIKSRDAHLTQNDDVYDIPRSSGIVDFDSPPPSPPEEEEDEVGVPSKGNDKNNNIKDNDNVSQSTVVTEEEKPAKVKMAGRRRLCKVLYREDDNSELGEHIDEPQFSAITNFDSPHPQQTNPNGGVNEIRDILNDLSSRLEFLSLERKQAPKKVDPVDDLVKDGEISNAKKVVIPEYISVGSSFPLTSDSSVDVTKNNDVESVVEYEMEGQLWSESRGDDLDDRVHETKEPKRVDEKDVSRGRSFVFNDEEDEEGDNYVDRADKTKNSSQRIKKDEPKRVHQRLVSAGRSFLSNLRYDDDMDDCVVLTGRKMSKEAERRGGKFKESDRPNVIDVLDNDTDNSMLDDEGSIILSGSKSTYKLPGNIAKMLYPHQRDGLRWLWSLHCQGKGGILGDDMGLGKTMQICSFLAGLFFSGLIRRAIIVAPKTLLPHWIKELSAVGLSGKTREYFGTCARTRQYELQYVLQDKGILLTTYDIVRNNSKSLQGDACVVDESDEDSFTWDYMILDEGHLIKNPNTQRAKSLLEIPSAHRIVVSGTPIQNNLKELWALFNFCCPNLLGDKKWFKDRYESPILHGNDKKASDREKRIGSTVAKELREHIQPCFLRRLKSEVFHEGDATTNAKLSKKNEIIVWLRLTNCQRKIYEAYLNSELVLSAFDGSPLAALTILKKICDHPLLLTKRAAEDVLEGMDSMLNPEEASMALKLAMYIADVAETDDFQHKQDVSCKISFIMSLLEILIPDGHNVLIFSQTRKMLNLIQESLMSKGYEFLRIDGTTKASDRLKIVNIFQEGSGAPIFLLTSQVGGLGLTLTKADRVIVVDPAWNPSTDNQSVDRAYRIGQTKDVLVYRLMTCGTVEEKIYRKQIFKGGLFKTATEHKEQIRYFSQQDLRELFSLPKEGFDVSLTQRQLHEEHDSQYKMDEFLESHIKFLETQGIAGVSHHSLLFSKTAPVQVVQEEEEELRSEGTAFVGNSRFNSSVEHYVDGAAYAFKPKDVSLSKKSSSPEKVHKLKETNIRERINRISQLIANKDIVSKLPDKGVKLQLQIAELNSQLYKLSMANRQEKEVINLDDVTGDFQNFINI
ncbi:SNF2_N domain-containing protein/Helicase_C domain-containing protein [Cephalotus follicularis]|uniref:SNF2_N domain-containing protein/Helicase_C domain-containing protein n=1 Tax=Cephalotus follicularis TaxID=3775 RepID=A0A1Q3C278_CEPFO|nr:SNF2_N domain-containing protein/Helicase_C domain-containing protein [Cephalotus follicularis]